MTERRNPALGAVYAADDALVEGSGAYVPAPDPMPKDKADAVADAFYRVRDRFAGRRAAPLSALDHDAATIATALSSVAIHAEDLPDAEGMPVVKRAGHGFVDLQAFTTDAEVQAIDAVSPPSAIVGADVRALADAAIDGIQIRQAVATQLLRNDINALGNRHALREVDIRIGAAERSLAAVAMYRERQAGGIASLLLAPLIAVVTAAVTLAVRSRLDLAVPLLVVLGVGGFIVGPFVGAKGAAAGLRLERSAKGAADPGRSRLLRGLANIVAFGSVFGVPVAVGLIVALVAST
jgi:hypothetical protein